MLQPTLGQVVTDLDLLAIRDWIDELSRSAYDDGVHLVSFGGWNGNDKLVIVYCVMKYLL